MPTDSPYPESLIDESYLPDKQADVDLVTAQWANKLHGCIIDISAALGTTPHANAADLAARLANGLDANGFLLPPSNIRVVGKANAPFNTVQDALDSIDDASPQHPYTVLIAPGTYTEPITVKPYIQLCGTRSWHLSAMQNHNLLTILAPQSGPAIQFASNHPLTVSHLKLHQADSPLFTFDPAILGSIKINLNHCWVNGTSTTIPTLAEDSHPSFYAVFSTLEALNTQFYLFKDSGLQDYSSTLKTYHSSIQGKIECASPGESYFSFHLQNSLFQGTLVAQVFGSDVRLRNSAVENYSEIPLQLGTEDYAEALCHWSSLRGPDGTFPISRLDAFNTINLQAVYSVFTGALPAFCTLDIADGHNIFNEYLRVESYWA